MLIVGPYELADPASIFPKNNKIFFEANLVIKSLFSSQKSVLIVGHKTALRAG